MVLTALNQRIGHPFHGVELPFPAELRQDLFRRIEGKGLGLLTELLDQRIAGLMDAFPV